MEEELEQEEQLESQESVNQEELFKPTKKGFFTLLLESFKFFTLNLPAIATIVLPVFLVVEFLVPLFELVFNPNFAYEFTSWEWFNEWINDGLNWIIKIITVEFIRQVIGGIAWIAVIRVIAGAMHSKRISGVQAMKDGATMLPMYFVTAAIYYVLLILSSFLLIIPGVIFAVYCAFWQYSYVLRGKGAFSALTYSSSLVKDDFVRVFLSVVGITTIISILKYGLVELISGAVAGAIDPDEDLLYDIVNTILMALGKILELGIEIIFFMMLFMTLEEENTETHN
tara:strand:+ start:495 stop:1346 length:852 start_codon:yes stop_codon:yes gene_type:complete